MFINVLCKRLNSTYEPGLVLLL